MHLRNLLTYLVPDVLLGVVLLRELEGAAVVGIGEVGLLDRLEGVDGGEHLEARRLFQVQEIQVG